MIAASLVCASGCRFPRLISLAFNSQAQAPQQIGSDEFRQKLLALSGKRIVIDYARQRRPGQRKRGSCRDPVRRRRHGGDVRRGCQLGRSRTRRVRRSLPVSRRGARKGGCARSDRRGDRHQIRRQGADAAGVRQAGLSQCHQFQAADSDARRPQGPQDPRHPERDLSDDLQGARRRSGADGISAGLCRAEGRPARRSGKSGADDRQQPALRSPEIPHPHRAFLRADRLRRQSRHVRAAPIRPTRPC